MSLSWQQKHVESHRRRENETSHLTSTVSVQNQQLTGNPFETNFEKNDMSQSEAVATDMPCPRVFATSAQTLTRNQGSSTPLLVDSPHQETLEAWTNGLDWRSDLRGPDILTYPENFRAAKFHQHPLAHSTGLSLEEQASNGLIIPKEFKRCKTVFIYDMDERYCADLKHAPRDCRESPGRSARHPVLSASEIQHEGRKGVDQTLGSDLSSFRAETSESISNPCNDADDPSRAPTLSWTSMGRSRPTFAKPKPHLRSRVGHCEGKSEPNPQLAPPLLAPMEHVRVYLLEKSSADKENRVCKLSRPTLPSKNTSNHDRVLPPSRSPTPRSPSSIQQIFLRGLSKALRTEQSLQEQHTTSIHTPDAPRLSLISSYSESLERVDFNMAKSQVRNLHCVTSVASSSTRDCSPYQHTANAANDPHETCVARAVLDCHEPSPPCSEALHSLNCKNSGRVPSGASPVEAISKQEKCARPLTFSAVPSTITVDPTTNEAVDEPDANNSAEQLIDSQGTTCTDGDHIPHLSQTCPRTELSHPDSVAYTGKGSDKISACGIPQPRSRCSFRGSETSTSNRLSPLSVFGNPSLEGLKEVGHDRLWRAAPTRTPPGVPARREDTEFSSPSSTVPNTPTPCERGGRIRPQVRCRIRGKTVIEERVAAPETAAPPSIKPTEQQLGSEWGPPLTPPPGRALPALPMLKPVSPLRLLSSPPSPQTLCSRKLQPTWEAPHAETTEICHEESGSYAKPSTASATFSLALSSDLGGRFSAQDSTLNGQNGMPDEIQPHVESKTTPMLPSQHHARNGQQLKQGSQLSIHRQIAPWDQKHITDYFPTLGQRGQQPSMGMLTIAKTPPQSKQSSFLATSGNSCRRAGDFDDDRATLAAQINQAPIMSAAMVTASQNSAPNLIPESPERKDFRSGSGWKSSHDILDVQGLRANPAKIQPRSISETHAPVGASHRDPETATPTGRYANDVSRATCATDDPVIKMELAEKSSALQIEIAARQYICSAHHEKKVPDETYTRSDFSLNSAAPFRSPKRSSIGKVPVSGSPMLQSATMQQRQQSKHSGSSDDKTCTTTNRRRNQNTALRDSTQCVTSPMKKNSAPLSVPQIAASSSPTRSLSKDMEATRRERREKQLIDCGKRHDRHSVYSDDSLRPSDSFSMRNTRSIEENTGVVPKLCRPFGAPESSFKQMGLPCSLDRQAEQSQRARQDRSVLDTMDQQRFVKKSPAELRGSQALIDEPPSEADHTIRQRVVGETCSGAIDSSDESNVKLSRDELTAEKTARTQVTLLCKSTGSGPLRRISGSQLVDLETFLRQEVGLSGSEAIQPQPKSGRLLGFLKKARKSAGGSRNGDES